MKRYLTVVLMILIAFGVPANLAAAKPGGSTKVFSAKIVITASMPTALVDQTVTLTANWSATLGINRTEWYIDEAAQPASLQIFRKDTKSGQSSFVFKGTEARDYALQFRIWKEGDISRDAAQVFTLRVNPAVLRYVSLGDSIATGTTTPLTADTIPYTDQFASNLKTANPGITVYRSAFETDGYRTNEIYDLLGLGDVSATVSTNQTLISAVAAADVITLSIGGNNLMQACKTDSILQPYDFFNPDLAVSDQGYEDFMSQYDDIMAKIHTLNSDALVIVMTLYNPYNLSDTTMHEHVDGYYIGTSAVDDGMNDLILGLADDFDYHVADVFTEFDQYNSDMSAVTLLYPSSWLRNPHPNQFGQNLIENLHVELYQLQN